MLPYLVLLTLPRLTHPELEFLFTTSVSRGKDGFTKILGRETRRLFAG